MSRSLDIVCGTIKHRITKKDKDFMLLIVGERGSGKSLAAMALACKIDPEFKQNPILVYTVYEFLEAVLKAKKGQVIVFDEVGVGVPAREWHQLNNMIMSIIAQILRYKNICVIFTTPNIRYVDVNVREAMNGFIKTRYIDDVNNINACNYKVYLTNDNGEVVKRKYIHYDGNSGAAGEIIDPLYIPRPEPEIEAYYKKVSINMKNSKLRELKQMMDAEITTPQEEKSTKNKAFVCIRLLEHYKKSSTWDELSEISGMSKRQLQYWISDAGGSAQAGNEGNNEIYQTSKPPQDAEITTTQKQVIAHYEG